MLSKGNYGVNWGNLDFGQGVLSPVLTRNLFLQSPFGLATTGLGPITIRYASFTEGPAIRTSLRSCCKEPPTTSAGRSGTATQVLVLI